MVIMPEKGLSRAMNARIIGSGDETIILGHGYGADQSIWDKVLPNLAPKYKVVVFDWSFSGAIKDPNLFDMIKYSSYDAFADDLIALMEEMKLESSTFIGHSMSGIIGCIASIKKPQLFKKLILVGSSPRFINCEGYEGGFGRADIEQILTGMESNYEQWVSSFAALAVDANDPDSVQIFAKCLLRMKQQVAHCVAKTVFLGDERDTLEKVTTPCTIIQSTNDIVVPNSVVEFMKNKIKGKSTVEFVEATGHFPHLTAHVQFNEEKNVDLSPKIKEGFGPNGLGILSISDVPGYSLLRQNLLHLSTRLANLSEEVKKELEDPHSRYNFGWSHGKEKLESGKPDMLKGSFYANPILDVPTSEESFIHRYPSYCAPNIWPHTALPELEMAFKALGKLILDVGLMVAYHCDRYVSKEMMMCADEGLEQILLHSRCHKGRLLYYFPAKRSNLNQEDDSMSSWCGWHTDHGSLTGLTCGMFMRDAVEIPCPDSAAGLYIKTRNGQIVKVVYGEDEIAYQIGETTEILSRGHLCATPHCVRAPKGEEAFALERSTFALFMQPDWDEKLNFPEVVHIHQELISSGGSLTFGEYTEKLLDKYYHLKTT